VSLFTHFVYGNQTIRRTPFSTIESTTKSPDLQIETAVTSAMSTQEQLLKIDSMLADMVPTLMKHSPYNFNKSLKEDVVYEDNMYGYKGKGSSSLSGHILKFRLYFRYKSPYNKFEYLGAAFHEGKENYLTLLWRFHTTRSGILTRYNPLMLFFKGMRENRKVEGALDIYVNGEGKIYKLINRQVTEFDRVAATATEELKRTLLKTSSKQEKLNGGSKETEDDSKPKIKSPILSRYL